MLYAGFELFQAFNENTTFFKILIPILIHMITSHIPKLQKKVFTFYFTAYKNESKERTFCQ